ncbi:MAG: helix-turn-helix domain-containing protein [Nostocaceae cyanobacterium]|nr:helix-turn-helix domain-containing protein [Nostocaceae cyanobacterium]
MPSNHVTPAQAAKYYGVHVGTLRRWENEGKIQAVKTLLGSKTIRLTRGVRTRNLLSHYKKTG